MPTPLTPQQFRFVKFSAVCSYEAYERLHKWHYIERYKNIPAQFVVPVTKSYYTNTTHREYLSRWLESIITAYCRYYNWRVIKQFDKGRKIKAKSGKEVFVKTRYTKAGTADLLIIANGRAVNVEVKVKADRQSDKQQIEQHRAEANNEAYVIVHTLPDWYRVMDAIIEGKAIPVQWPVYPDGCCIDNDRDRVINKF